MDRLFLERLQTLLREDQVQCNEPISNHTTFRIGGPADYMIHAETIDEVRQIIFCCKQANISYFILGNGSNLLFNDNGYRGAVIHMKGREDAIHVRSEGEKLMIEGDAGILLSKFSMYVCKLGYEGFEFATGIPGSLGGAVYMNAGAYGGEIKDCIESATIVDELGQIKTLTKEELEFDYRSSIFQRKNYIIASATFSFRKGNVDEILEKAEGFNQSRREKQPLEYPSAGSMFKRPVGYFAGKLIMDAGLRGYRVGDAMISEKHCGFVVNMGNATAKEVLQLIHDVQQIIFEKFGVRIEREVRFIDEKGGGSCDL